MSPGFIDVHNHGNSGFDVMDITEKALDRIGEYHLSKGAQPEQYIKTLNMEELMRILNLAEDKK